MVAIVPGIGHGSRVAFDGSRSLEVRDLQVHHNDWCINETDVSTGTTHWHVISLSSLTNHKLLSRLETAAARFTATSRVVTSNR